MADRREFLAASLASAVALGLPSTVLAKVAKPMKILVLGGTGFLGPHFVEAARARGHVLTLFNRGKTNPGLFPDIEKLQGDRKTDLKALEGRRWDAVLDTSAYIPADVTRSAGLLSKNVGHYLIVSTISVYAKLDKPGMDENSPLVQLADPTVDKVSNDTYGGLKALCEKAAERQMPGRVTVVRPGLIVGPGDTTDRFTYWPARAARGGEILAPEAPGLPTQFIDVRDLAEFLLRCLELKTLGVFNADSQAGSITFGAMIDTCRRIAGTDSSVSWLPADFLEQQKIGAWMDLPCWIPAQGDEAGFGRISAAAAKAAGLAYRPLEQTVRDTLDWWKALPEDRRSKPKAGLSPDREAAALAAWRAK